MKSGPRPLLVRSLVALGLGLLLGCASTPPSHSARSSEAQTGLASYYHDRFHGRTTASGETYDRDALTAAHRTLPFGTLVDVRNLENDRKVRLRINDRGPFVEGRIIDVSRRAARELGFLDQGLVEVSVKVVN